MDMYYSLKEKLLCQDCKYPLTFSKTTGYMSYIAVCIVCGKEFEITLDIKLRKEND